MQKEEYGMYKGSMKNIIRIACAFIAWVIGAGFATGQEVLQFFSSYGYWSYGVVAINLIGFIWIGYLLMRSGHVHKGDLHFNHFKYFCGKRLGTFYTCLVTATLLLLIPVLVAGGGATLKEYYGISTGIGSAVMVISALTAYMIGFEKMVRIISLLGPVIIVFSLIVGCVTLITDYGKWPEVPAYEAYLAPYRAASHWLPGGLMYLGLNMYPGSTYFVKLGAADTSEKELKFGALLGGTILMLSVSIMGTAIMLNGDAAAGLDIPVLYLARRISRVFGAVFSVVLVLGIFSSCSAMLWSVCSRLSFGKDTWNKALAAGVAVYAYLISLFSFGKLMSTIYPLIGYIGLIFVFCVLRKGVGGLEKKPVM